MPKFIKKPVTVSAQLNCVDDNTTQQYESWFIGALTGGNIIPNDDGSLTVKTLEGDMRCSPGDWVIQGVKGELYPCKPDIFAATYTPVGE